MNYYTGIDVSLEQSSVCVRDGDGNIVREAKVASEPESLIAWFANVGLAMSRIGLEAGPLSQWLYAGMKQAGLPVELLETRHVRTAFKTMPVKTDRKDARGIAELMRMGWFRPVHCKSMSAQETRAMLTTRRLIDSKLRDVEMNLRGVLRGFGLKVGKTTPTNFADRIKELVSGHPTLQTIADSLLAVREVLLREFRGYEKRVRTMARHSEDARLLMTTTGVGAVISLTYASAVDDPERFKNSKNVGAHYGMTPKRYQSGDTDYTGRISKVGDKSVRTALYQAAHIILTRPVKASALKTWAMQLAKRIGMAKAKVALARKLAVIMHRMLVERKPFDHKMLSKATAAA
jgi:transposase